MDIDPTAHTRDVDGRVHTGRGAIVILEGLDATGKTTVAMDLYKTLSAPVAILHAGAPLVTTAIREYVWPLGIAATGYVVICDRWHLGELVWPTIFERDPIIADGAELRHIEENMMYLSTPIMALMMQRAHKEIAQELYDRGEGDDFLGDAVDLYDQALKESGLSWQNATMHGAPDTVRRWLDDVTR